METVEVPGDDPALVALVADQQSELSRRYGGGDDAVRESPQPPLSAAARWLVIRGVDGEPIGCVAVQPLSEEHGQQATGEVKRLYVAPEARGQGLSRQLMSAAEELGRRMGFERMWLETGTAQPEAMGLYSSSGWTPIAPYGHWRDSPASRAFAKALTGTAGPLVQGESPA